MLNNIKIIRVFFAFTVFFSHIVNAQDPQFTQFYSSPLYLNPSFAGSVGCSRAAFSYRNEGPGMSNKFVTYHLSYDQYVHPVLGGIGFDSWYDIAGEGTTSTYYNGLIYSPKFIFKGKILIAPSIEVGYGIKTIEWEKVIFSDTTDPRIDYITPIRSNMSFFNISSGILLNSENFYGGFALNHIFESLLSRKYTFHLGYDYQKDQYSKFTLSPNIIYQRQQDFQQINLGLYAGWNKIIVGIWYRMAEKSSDAFIAMISIRYKKFRVGYSYDITLSKLSNANTGSHEITLGCLFNCKNKEDKIIALETISF